MVTSGLAEIIYKGTCTMNLRSIVIHASIFYTQIIIIIIRHIYIYIPVY